MGKNELIKTEEQTSVDLFGFKPATVTLTKEQAQEATGVKGKRYFPFLTLVQKTSRVIEQGANPGVWIFKENNKDPNFVNLSSTFQAFILGIRGKALFWDKTQEMMNTEYCIAKTNNELFKTDNYDEYVKKALVGVPGTYSDNPYRQGLEVLLWLPHPDVNAFVTYFANSPKTISAVEEDILPFVNNAVIWSSNRKENKKGVFYVPTCTPLTTDEALEIENTPSPEQYKEAIDLFINPPRFSSLDNEDTASFTSAEKAEPSKFER